MKRIVVFLLVLSASFAIGHALFGWTGDLLALVGDFMALCYVLAIGAFVDAGLALMGAPSALADRILTGLGLIKKKSASDKD